jgi:hypothetical protein
MILRRSDILAKMPWKVRMLACALLAGSIASAQPAVYLRGVVNAASSAPAGLPNGSIAQGSLFSIYGASLGPLSPRKH